MHGTRGLVGPNRVEQLRQDCGLTQERLAELVGTSRNTIGMVERRQQAPSIDLARKIALALGSDLNTVFPSEAPEPIEAKAS